MKKKLIILTLSLILLLTACNLVIAYDISEVNLDLGLYKDYRIVYINDLHLQAQTEELDPEKADFMTSRISEFSFEGLTTEMRIANLSEAINKVSPDLVVLGGDILDFCSEKNCELLKEALSKLDAPYIYIRSDHDVEPYWLADKDHNKCNELQNGICDNSPIIYYDLDEVIVMGINFSQNNISESAVLTAKEIFSKGKPVIVATHVPFDTLEDASLQAFSAEKRDGRLLYWGDGTEYVPDGNTREFMDMIYAADSPVAAVFAAHIHDEWEGNISDNAIEHIFAPCYKGRIGVINVH